MAKSRTSEKQILRQIPAARSRSVRERAAGRRATSARYDPASGRVMIELSNGCVFGFLAESIPALVGASASDLAAVRLSPGGSGLHWERLDADLSVPGLLLASVGQSDKLSEFARLAGRSTSRAKAAAARANGAKGGRPRKLTTR